MRQAHMTQVQRACSKALAAMVEECPELVAATVSTKDGFEVARCGAATGKTAVMTGTLQALAEALTAECGFAECQGVMVEAGAHKLVVTPVEGVGMGSLVLTSMVGPEMSLALLARHARECSEQIAKLYGELEGGKG